MSATAGSEPDWVGGQGSAYLAFSVRSEDGRAVYVGFSNAGGVEAATIPAPPAGTSWHRVVDTGTLLPVARFTRWCTNVVVRPTSIPLVQAMVNDYEQHTMVGQVEP